jgi:transporter family protein
MTNTNWLFWALLSAFFAGVTAILAKIGVAAIDSNLATAIRTSVVLVFTWLIVFIASPRVNLSSISNHTWLFLILSGLATGLSWLCYFRALQLGEASRVAPMDKLSILFVLIFAATFLHERLTGPQYLGAGLILCGSILLGLKH